MKLNLLERLFILSPVRPLVQRYFESKQLLEMGGSLNGGRALEIGCGQGSGIDLIYDRFGAIAVDAFDLDPRMLARSLRSKRSREKTTCLWAGNVRQIPVANDTYDAVFNFGVLHHVVDWRATLREIRRVLKPGGRFYCEEILAHYITHPFWGRLMVHPQEDRFDQAMLLHALHQSGFVVESTRVFGNLYVWMIADKP